MPAFTHAHGPTSLGRYRSSSRVLETSVSLPGASVLFVWSISLIWFVLFVWFEERKKPDEPANQRDQRNQMNQINRSLLGPGQGIVHNLLGFRDDRL